MTFLLRYFVVMALIIIIVPGIIVVGWVWLTPFIIQPVVVGRNTRKKFGPIAILILADAYAGSARIQMLPPGKVCSLPLAATAMVSACASGETTVWPVPGRTSSTY
ncbi:MAG: hypothetical protein DDT35_01105 [Firmicutes bacterium]|nr:hypothetical protein [Bacillota bacterium]